MILTHDKMYIKFLLPTKTKGVIFMKQESTSFIGKTTLMHVMDAFGLALFVAALTYLLLNWSSLPAEVPFFGFMSENLQYGSKWELFLFPIITFFIGVGLQFLEKHPDWRYSPMNITDANVEKEVKQSTVMISFIKNMTSLLLAVLIWETIHIAQGNSIVLEEIKWLIVAAIIIFPTFMTVISALKE